MPWSEKNEVGRFRLKTNSGVSPVLDIHSHVGWSYGFARSVGYRARNEPIYLYDYEVDQDVLFEERHPFPVEQKRLGKEMNFSPYQLAPSAATHTAANFAAEMDRFNVKHACLLPIEGPIMSRHAEDTMRASALDVRFIPFGGVFPWPWGRRKIERLKNLLSRAVRAVKVHPEFQFIAADHPHQLKLFEWGAENGVPVLAHCGYTGAEPAWRRTKAEPDKFRVVLRNFPKLQLLLAHTGLSRRNETLAVARDFPKQVWLDISGQQVTDLKMILDSYDRDRICFGSDWPFYPLWRWRGHWWRRRVAPSIGPRCFTTTGRGFWGWPFQATDNCWNYKRKRGETESASCAYIQVPTAMRMLRSIEDDYLDLRTSFLTHSLFRFDPDGVNQHLVWTRRAAPFVAVNLRDNQFHRHTAHFLMPLIKSPVTRTAIGPQQPAQHRSLRVAAARSPKFLQGRLLSNQHPFGFFVLQPAGKRLPVFQRCNQRCHAFRRRHPLLAEKESAEPFPFDPLTYLRAECQPDAT